MKKQNKKLKNQGKKENFKKRLKKRKYPLENNTEFQEIAAISFIILWTSFNSEEFPSSDLFTLLKKDSDTF